MWRRYLTLVGVNLLVSVVLLELVSVGFHFLNTGELVYVRDKRRVAELRAQLVARPLQAATDSSLMYRLHPYFGFVYRTGFVQQGVPTNNFGFLTPDDFPFKKTSRDQFVIGIFGGSVAALFSFYERQHHVLAEAIQRSAFPRSKDVVVLSFAAGSYKQPQQLLILSYFLSIGQDFDLVVNIDGFNEVALSYVDNRSGVEVSMPSVSLISPLIDLADKDLSSRALALTLEALRRRGRLSAALAALDDCHLALCYSLRWIQVQYLANRYARDMKALSWSKRREPMADSLISLKRGPSLDDEEATERIANEWATSSLLMSQLLAARTIPYVHIIQPNQYYPTARQFSDEEKRIAFTDAGAAEAGVIEGYPKLLSRNESLRASSVNVFNGANLFDAVPGIVYADNCCHYNNAGNAVFARYVAQCVLSVLDRPRGDGQGAR